MDTRKIPPIVTLPAALAAAIVTYVRHYELKTALWIILASIVGFFFLGSLLKFLFDKLGMSEEAMEKRREEERKRLEEEARAAREAVEPEDTDGSVIEKEA